MLNTAPLPPSTCPLVEAMGFETCTLDDDTGVLSVAGEVL